MSRRRVPRLHCIALYCITLHVYASLYICILHTLSPSSSFLQLLVLFFVILHFPPNPNLFASKKKLPKTFRHAHFCRKRYPKPSLLLSPPPKSDRYISPLPPGKISTDILTQSPSSLENSPFTLSDPKPSYPLPCPKSPTPNTPLSPD